VKYLAQTAFQGVLSTAETGTAGSVPPSPLCVSSPVEAGLEVSVPRLVSLLSCTPCPGLSHKATGKRGGSMV